MTMIESFLLSSKKDQKDQPAQEIWMDEGCLQQEKCL